MKWPYKCDDCDLIIEFEAKSLKYTPDLLDCNQCQSKAKPAYLRINFSLGGSTSEYARRRFPYYDEGVGQTFTSLEQKTQYLKDNNLRIKDKGEKADKTDPLDKPFDETKKKEIIQKVKQTTRA